MGSGSRNSRGCDANCVLQGKSALVQLWSDERNLTRIREQSQDHIILEVQRFPDATLDSHTASPDLEHSFSGVYVRGSMREGAHAWALLAVPPDENAMAVERSGRRSGLKILK
jgi:hypothetical protein